MNAETLIQAMKKVLEAPDYPLLQSYKNDFYDFDVATLGRQWTSRSRAIWVVTPNGTHLSFIGQHKRQIESVEAILNTGYRDTEIYLLSSRGVTAISANRARSEAQDLQFEIVGQCIYAKSGAKLAEMLVQPGAQRHRFSVHFTSAPELIKDDVHLSALTEIALHEATIFNASVFTGVTLVTLDEDVVVGSKLVKLKPVQKEHEYVVCKSVKVADTTTIRVLDSANEWSNTIAKAQAFVSRPVQFKDVSCFVMTKQRAAQHLAQESYLAKVA